MNTVLFQELLRYNRLIVVIRQSLINIGRGIKGEVVMSDELEQIANALYDNLVPPPWKKYSFNTLKPLASFTVDVLKRLKEYQSWIDNGHPPCFWISGFHFVHSFLTGVRQNYARKYKIPIDAISYNFKIISDPKSVDTSKKPDDGAFVHGLLIEGCRWDSDNEYLDESHPKVLISSVPIMWLMPVKNTQLVRDHTYDCPLYITLERKGILSTIGISNNFVMMTGMPMQRQHTNGHWIKRGVAMVTQTND